MDKASIIGLLGALYFLSLGIEDVGALIDMPSVYLVVGATSMIMLYRSKLSDAISLGSVIGKVFINKTEEPESLIDALVALAQIARKDGMIALEAVEQSNLLLQNGVAGLVDGTKAELIQQGLEREKDLMASRHKTGSDILSAGAELAPGMGMIGTLIGLVNLLSNLDDPSSIGPNMALALLTTLYGSLLANVFFIPMGMKLEGYAKREANNNDLIIVGIMFIKSGKNPRLLEDNLSPFMSPKAKIKREAAQNLV
ncbi:MAG: chemotaxis protein MotA [Gammaproteobacteria bacterium]|jgi:chemotaxis protein MotA